MFRQQLENSLNEFGEKWVLNPGDGAFYGPKASHMTHLADARRLTATRRRSSSAGLLCRSTLRSRTPSAATTSAPPSSWTSSSPSASTSPSSGLSPLNPNGQRVAESPEMITGFLPSVLRSHDGDDKKRPVIIHRAILGSVERMIAILTENYGGKWLASAPPLFMPSSPTPLTRSAQNVPCLLSGRCGSPHAR